MSDESCSKTNFKSDSQVRWCPGCGDYSILSAVQSILPKLGRKREDVAFVSGIGCSSRFPYYMNTYGFHTIHGRAPAIATGLKAINPNLMVWVITGDGDGLSIGGNHLLHALRRNVDLKILFFNNEIYGLTKGQLSPTSKQGSVTSSTPYGGIDQPINPIRFALAAGATFVARTLDNDVAHMQKTFEAAGRHKGVAFVEILQNCVIFNDKTHEPYIGRTHREEGLLHLEEGEPLRFGAGHGKGIFAENLEIEVAPIGEGAHSKERVLIHKPNAEHSLLTHALADFTYPHRPVPIGIFKQVNHPEYHHLVQEQEHAVIRQEGPADLGALFRAGPTWTID
jgi:2-oxoglutarate ferredoxin oxidoreductase subunit beta